MAGKVPVYEMVRERILSRLSEGTVPWKQTWESMSPVNMLTGKPYRGINRILLAGCSQWGTFRQIEKLGGHVRKGEKAAGMVVFWSWETTRKRKDEITGDEVKVRVQRDRPLVRYYPVFHPGQCDGLAVEALAEPVRRVASCDEVLRQNKPAMAMGEPAYAPAQDVIFMPPVDRFGCAESYYATLFHEMTHWTGHTDRLKRDGVVKKAFFGSEQYGREELTAEMGSAFLCSLCRVETPDTEENAAAYVAGWLRSIREGSAMDVVKAAQDAEKAVDFLTASFPAGREEA